MTATQSVTFPSSDRLPGHVAIIMDGNGRWAKRRALPREMGHRAGVESMREIIRETGRLHIEALTLYGFSTERITSVFLLTAFSERGWSM